MNDRFLRSLASLKLTLALFVTFGVLASLGSFFPQGEDAAAQVIAKYGHDTYVTLNSLGLLDAYHSWWFIVVIGMLATNLIACTWVRLPKIWKMSQESAGATEQDPDIPSSSVRAEISSPLPVLSAVATAQRVLADEFPKVIQTDGPSATMLVAEKNRLALWGAYIVHLGLLTLALGGVLKVLWGYSHYVVVHEGKSAEIPRDIVKFGLWTEPVRVPFTQVDILLPRFYSREETKHEFQVYLDHFEVQYHKATGAPSLFRSDVTLLKGGRSERAASILVNEPLSVGGLMLYQASWGYEGLNSARFKVTLPGEKDPFEVVAPYRKRFKMLDSGWELEVTDFYPDADMVAPGKLENKSNELRNPAVRVKFFRRGKERAHAWFVYAFPEIQMAKVPGLKLQGMTVDPVPFSVLLVNHDPGVPFALVGALIILFGVGSSFYLFYRKIWVLVRPGPDGGSLLVMAGLAKRNKVLFKRTFNSFVQRLQARLDALPKG